MGKKTVRQESVLKEAKRIWMHVQKNLREADTFQDLAWRPVGTPLGPPGWSFVLGGRNVSGPDQSHGFAFGPNPPTVKQVEEAVATTQKKLDSALLQSKLIVPEGVIPQGKIIT